LPKIEIAPYDIVRGIGISMNAFLDSFINSGDKTCVKWSPYFDAYEKHLSKYRQKSPFVLEIGVSKGGSLRFWSEVFGKESKIVGIDILEECKDHSDHEKNIYVEIGNGRSAEFMSKIFDTYGYPDIVIDDGDHNSQSMRQSLFNIWPYLKDNGIYIVEDLHGIYWQSKENWDVSFFQTLSDEVTGLNAPGSRGHAKQTKLSDTLSSISFFWSLAILEKSTKLKPPQALGSQNGQISVVNTVNI